MGAFKEFHLDSFIGHDVNLPTSWQPTVISRFQSNSNVLYLINCGNKSKSFLSFISFIVVSQHRAQVSYTSSHTSKKLINAAYAAQYKTT